MKLEADLPEHKNKIEDLKNIVERLRDAGPV